MSVLLEPPVPPLCCYILGSGAGGCPDALAAFLAERNEGGMEIGDELEAPSVTAVPAGLMWTRLSGSG